MKLVAVSDWHLGASRCALVEGDRGQRHTTEIYQRLVATIRAYDGARDGSGIDYLVLLGDIMDFSVASQGDAYDAAQVVFAALAAEMSTRGDYLIKQIIYVPGNHDFSVWSTIMHQANVVNRLKTGRPVVDRWSSPGIIDDRASAGSRRGRIHLPKVTSRADGRYGGLYLDALTRIEGRAREHEPRLTINVAYPNLYVVESTRTTLLTHGHYLETAWALTAELTMRIVGEDLSLLGGTEPSIDDIVALNLPFAELTSASLGMAGPLVSIARTLQREYKERADHTEDALQLPTFRTYIRRLKEFLDRSVFVPGGVGVVEKVYDVALDRLEAWAIKRLQHATPARHDKDFPAPMLIQGYHAATDLERDQLARAHALAIPEVTNLIVGHSHQYVPWAGPSEKKVELLRHNGTLAIANTGGWLRDRGKIEGGIFFYDQGTWSSTVIDS